MKLSVGTGVKKTKKTALIGPYQSYDRQIEIGMQIYYNANQL